MPIFVRRSERPTLSNDYRSYRAKVREDFTECCAYCLLPEILAGGQDNFELDHFRPKSKSDRLLADINDFYNLYYCCHVCNHYKAASWPTDELVTIGCRFIDFCSEEFSAHFRPEPDGSWVPLTLAACYAGERLRLNRKHLVKIRGLLNQIAELQGCDPLDWSCPTRDQLSGILLDGSNSTARHWPNRVEL